MFLPQAMLSQLIKVSALTTMSAGEEVWGWCKYRWHRNACDWLDERQVTRVYEAGFPRGFLVRIENTWISWGSRGWNLFLIRSWRYNGLICNATQYIFEFLGFFKSIYTLINGIFSKAWFLGFFQNHADLDFLIFSPKAHLHFFLNFLKHAYLNFENVLHFLKLFFKVYNVTTRYVHRVQLSETYICNVFLVKWNLDDACCIHEGKEISEIYAL